MATPKDAVNGLKKGFTLPEPGPNYATKPSSGKHAQDEVVDIGGKKTVLYMDSSEGPFRCDHCEYYVDPRQCQLVDGDIDPAGCCSLYESIDKPEPQSIEQSPLQKFRTGAQ